MSISLSKERLCAVIGGTPVVATPQDMKLSFLGVQFDSREVRGGELFFALKGATTHGHQYVGAVLDAGAALVVVEDRDLFLSSPYKERIIVVPDSLDAFSELARWWRRELQVPLFAITGSVGKTTVKEIAAHVLLGTGPGAYSKKSFNNHVGVPFTLCGMTREHRWAVVEMGMSHAGEISRITKIAEPDHVGITCIAPAHLESFESLDGIAAAKFEIVQGLKPGGTVVLRHADPCLAARLAVEDPQRELRVAFFGDDASCEARVSALESFGVEGIGFRLTLRDGEREESQDVRMSILGTQNAYNAACATLIAKRLAPSISHDEIAQRLRSFVAPMMRMNCRQFEDGTWLIDDSYNANPASMGAFLSVARDLSNAGHTVALIIGDMLEMGVRAEALHREIGLKVVDAHPAAVAAVGPLARHYVEAIPQATTTDRSPGIAPKIAQMHTLSPEEAARWVLSQPRSIIMVKASRGIQLDRAVQMINTQLASMTSGG